MLNLADPADIIVPYAPADRLFYAREKAELEQLQATAAQQQKQAESLKNQLTQELTKAGGDPRGTDPRLVKLQDALGAADGVSLVSPPQINDSGDAVIYSVIATTAPSDPETADLAAEFVTLVTSNRAFDVFTDAGFAGIARE